MEQATTKSRSKDTRTAIVIDTREQAPYRFDPEIATVTQGALPAGDYSLAGYEESIAIERKTLDDFVSTVIHGRERFKRELEKLRTYDFSCVVVEADLRDVIRGSYRSRAHPNSIFGSALAIYADYRIPVLFCSDREIASRVVMGLLVRYGRKLEESVAPERSAAHE